jgi:hypothetical protein
VNGQSGLVRASRTATLLLILATAGCGGSSVPKGHPVSVQVEIFLNPFFVVPNVTWPQPFAVHAGETEWERVSRLLPDRLPEPLDKGSECPPGQSGYVLSVRLSSGGDVDYGPCGWPDEIVPVRLLMRTLQQRDVAAKRRCDCP